MALLLRTIDLDNFNCTFGVVNFLCGTVIRSIASAGFKPSSVQSFSWSCQFLLLHRYFVELPFLRRSIVIEIFIAAIRLDIVAEITWIFSAIVVIQIHIVGYTQTLDSFIKDLDFSWM